MREINKTIYDILKMSDPTEDISVTQLITDEVVKKSESGEIKAGSAEEATGVLNLKALNLEKEKQSKKEGTNTGIRRQIKASGKNPRTVANTSPSKKIVTKSGKVTSAKKVIRPVKKKSVSKAAAKKDDGNLMKMILVALLLCLAVYLYLELA